MGQHQSDAIEKISGKVYWRENERILCNSQSMFIASHSLAICPSILQIHTQKIVDGKKFLMHKGAEEKKKTKSERLEMLQH